MMQSILVHGAGKPSDSAHDVDTACILVLMIVNLVATLCIAVKAWYGGLEAFFLNYILLCPVQNDTVTNTIG